MSVELRVSTSLVSVYLQGLVWGKKLLRCRFETQLDSQTSSSLRFYVHLSPSFPLIQIADDCVIELIEALGLLQNLWTTCVDAVDIPMCKQL